MTIVIFFSSKLKEKTDSKFICNVSLDFYITFFTDTRNQSKKNGGGCKEN